MKRSRTLRITVSLLLLLLTNALLAVPATAQTLYIWGSNTYGLLGNGHRNGASFFVPTVHPTLTSVIQITGGSYHDLALKSDGTLWAWGNNQYGQLGDGTLVDRDIPTQITSIASIVQVAGGSAHTLALKSDGTVWAWGQNYGRLGDGTNTDRKAPVQTVDLTGVVQVAAGGNFSLALKSDGTVWAWGSNANGQLGNGTGGGNVGGYDKKTPVQVSNLTDVVQIATGWTHSLALKSDGTVWAWGGNTAGQVGDGTGVADGKNHDINLPVQVFSDIVQIATLIDHSLALKSDGTVWAWGSNTNGQLGIGTNSNSPLPVLVSGLTGVAQITVGGLHSLALKSDGTVWAWGYNTDGELGNGEKTIQTTPVQSLIQNTTIVSASGFNSMALVMSRTTTSQVPDQTFPYGAVPLSARITLGKTGFPLPLRKVTFLIDGKAVGNAMTDANGVAKITAVVAGGKHTLRATVSAKGRLNSGTGKGTLTITPIESRLKAESARVKLAESVNLKGTLTQKSNASPLPNRKVTFSLGKTVIGSAITDANGKATLFYKAETEDLVGKNTVTLTFEGDASYLKRSDTTSLTVDKGTTLLSQADFSGNTSSTLDITAKLTRSADDKAVSNRSVVFYVGGAKVGSGNTDASGVAKLSYTLPKNAGTYTLKVVFVGDNAYAKSLYDKATLTVK